MKFGTVATLLVVSAAAISANAARSQNNRDDSMQMVSGCLEAGPGVGGYSLLDEDGKLWSVRSDTVHFKPYVGQKVTLSGTVPPMPKNSPQSDQALQNYLNVTDLKVLSNTCQP